MKVDVCPGRDLLGSHLLGKVRGSKAESIDRHLAACESCLQAARQFKADDELTAAMRVERRPINGSPSEIAAVIERGKRLRTVIETLPPAETVTLNKRGKKPVPTHPIKSGLDTREHEPIDFLQPAEQPDEIGRLGDYRVLEVMGMGGMGVVFRAEDTRLERVVALKAMKPAMAATKSAKDRFLREAKATAALEHDNIVPIYQVGEDRNVPFIAMQLLRGESLQSRLLRENKLEQSEVVRIGREVATGLAAAHERDLIHRDIKPDNIWIEEGTGRAKILDFGLVLSVRDNVGLTRSGAVLGTPRYMAPEQAQGQRVDHCGDLFSLGSVMYHLVSGNPPFDGDSLISTLNAVVHEDPKPIEQICPNLNANLAKLIMQLLNKEVHRRPQSARDVAHSLAEIESELEAEKACQAAGSARRSVESTVAGRALPGIRQPKSGKPILIIGVAAALACSIFLALWLAGLIFKVETEHGTILVEIDGKSPGIEVSVAEDKVLTITDPNDGKQIKVAVDAKHKQLQLEKEGFKTVLAGFSLESPDRCRTKVSFQRKQEIAVANSAPPSVNSKTALPAARAEAEAPRSADPVRRLAERIIRFEGGVVCSDGKSIWDIKDIPSGPLRIVTVSFRGGARIQDEDIPLLAGLPHLENLSFGRNSLTDKGYASLAKLGTLKQINFVKVALTDQGLAELVRLPHLEMLELHHTGVTDDGLKALGQMPALKYLTLGVSFKRKFGPAYLTDAGLAHLTGVEKLEKLWLIGPTFTDQGIEHLAALKFLRVLAVWTPNISDAGMAELRKRLPVCAIYDKRGEPEPDADE